MECWVEEFAVRSWILMKSAKLKPLNNLKSCIFLERDIERDHQDVHKKNSSNCAASRIPPHLQTKNSKRSPF